MEIKETDQIKKIKNFAFQVRKNILEMAVSAGSSSAHFGGALSRRERDISITVGVGCTR